jgi:exopolysaccharide biosynthesis polyprenyl glycosylphosphotransferase
VATAEDEFSASHSWTKSVTPDESFMDLRGPAWSLEADRYCRAPDEVHLGAVTELPPAWHQHGAAEGVGSTVPQHGEPRRRQMRRGWLVRRMLLQADLVGLLGAFFTVEFAFAGKVSSAGIGVGLETAIFIATLPAWIVATKVYGLYDRDEQNAEHSTADEFPSIFHLVTVIVWLFFAVSWITGLTDPSQTKLATFWVLAIAGMTGCRVAARSLARRRPSYLQNALIIGAGDVGQLIARKLLNHPEYAINVVGFLDSAPKTRREDLGDLALLGSLDSVPDVVQRQNVERVIIAFSNESHDEMLDIVRSLKDLDVQVDIVPRLFEIIGPRMNINSIEGVSIVSIPRLRLSRSSRLLKRTFDLIAATLTIILLLPVLAAIALLTKLDSSGPVVFKQLRMGAGDRTFWIYKFRTMANGADAQKSSLRTLNKHAKSDSRMFKVPGDPRVTRAGRFLRRYSLDELPQLFNVLKGDMSLVGPRPLVLDEDEFVQAWARRRLSLRPGMTGFWQILGRTDIPFSEMVKLDYVYVTNWTLGGDLKIVARTIPAILRHQDAY